MTTQRAMVIRPVMCLLMAVALVYFPFGSKSTIAVTAATIHAEHTLAMPHHSDAGPASVPGCPSSSSDTICDMQCGAPHSESAKLSCTVEPDILQHEINLFGSSLYALAGLGHEPPDQPPRF